MAIGGDIAGRVAASVGFGEGFDPRGDAIVQFDFQVGAILDKLDELGLTENTLVILSSDNGPVLDDGYKDDAVEKVGDHKPAGVLRGGKYSSFDAGTREPFLVRWPKRVKPGVSDAFVSQVDLIASLAALTGQTLNAEDAPDSVNTLDAFLGNDKVGRDHIIEQGIGGLSFVEGDWKYISPSKRGKYAWQTGIETGADPAPQLYNLKDDPGETTNLAEKHPERVAELAAKLEKIKDAGRTRGL